ncbi:MAG: CPBP family intramembrane glutamic endopeptidase, partial [Myxococcota bacterium]|nr:CPBP family intramembrane glutamic endopeptidase [Myxococcota bacterium]
YLTPVYLICIFPLMLSGLPGVVLDPLYMALPLVNLALAMKQLLLGDVVMDQLFIVFLSSGIWTAMGLALAARMFSMESVLLGSGGVEALFHRRTGDGLRPPVPSVGEAVTLLGGVLLLSFYGPMLLRDGLNVGVLIHIMMWGFLLTPCVLLVVALRLSPRETFALRPPPARGLLAAALLGSGLWVLVSRVMEWALEDRWLPVPGPEMEAFSESLVTLSESPGGAALLFTGIALGPAICEEALFRGVLLQSLRRHMRARNAVLLSSVVFGLFHMNIYQLPTATLLGVLLGSLVIRFGSIWPAVLLHLLHNGLVLAVELYVPDDLAGDPALWLLCLLPVAAIGLFRGGQSSRD